MMDTNLNSQQKAATVIISLGADRASKLYQYLNESELEQLTYEVAKISHTTPEQTESALDDFYKMCVTQKVIGEGGVDYARNVLEKAFGNDAAASLIERVTNTLHSRAFEFVRESDGKNIHAIIQHERPQTIALILSYVDSDKAAEVISRLPPKKQVAVVDRIARMDSAAPDIVQAVESVLQKKFSSVVAVDFTKIGGVDYVADVMNSIDTENEKTIFQGLDTVDAGMAEAIRKRMFLFEEITTLDDMAIQKFLREVNQQDVVLALKGAGRELTNAFYANMSTRMAEAIQADLEITTNVRVRDVEEARQNIIAVIRRLEEEGELVITKGGKDEIIA